MPFEARRARLSGRVRVEGVSTKLMRCAAFHCRRGLRESERLPEPIFTPATKAETGHDENVSFAAMAAYDRRRIGRRIARPQHRCLSPSRRTCGAARHHPRRYQVRMGPAVPVQHQLHPDRRSADTGQFAVLAGRSISRRWPAAVVRQAIRPRLARSERLGQAKSAAAIARRRGRADGREISGSLRPTHGLICMSSMDVDSFSRTVTRRIAVNGGRKT